MGRCPKGCKGSLSIPLDLALELSAHQQSSEDLMRLGCLLSVVMPYELASWMLGQWSGLSISAATLWHWVQQKGHQAQVELEAALAAQAAGESVVAEPLSADLANLALAISAVFEWCRFAPIRTRHAARPGGGKSKSRFWPV